MIAVKRHEGPDRLLSLEMVENGKDAELAMEMLIAIQGC